MTNNIIDWFKHTDVYEKLSNCLNGIDENTKNKYHEERTVADHIMMVSNACIEKFKDDDDFYKILLACLLHDTGKFLVRNIKEDKDGNLKTTFYNHESAGYCYVVELLEDFMKTDIAKEINFDENDWLDVMWMVVHHDIYKFEDSEIAQRYRKYGKLISKLTYCDSVGRISSFPRNSEKYIDMIDIFPNYSNIENVEGKNKLTVLIGPPGSGKSIWAENHKSEYKYIISRDSLIAEIEKYIDSKYVTPNEKVLLRPMVDVCGYLERFTYLSDNSQQPLIDTILFRIYAEAVNNADGNILVDKTHLSKKSRRMLIHNLKMTLKNKLLKDFHRESIIFCVPMSELFERNKNRDKKINENIIYNMLKNAVLPAYDEYDSILFYKN